MKKCPHRVSKTHFSSMASNFAKITGDDWIAKTCGFYFCRGENRLRKHDEKRVSIVPASKFDYVNPFPNTIVLAIDETLGRQGAFNKFAPNPFDGLIGGDIVLVAGDVDFLHAMVFRNRNDHRQGY